MRLDFRSHDMVNFSLMSSCDEVREGETKQLDLSVLRVMDLDVPKNILRFSVVKAPEHGSIIDHSSDRPGSKRREASRQSTVVHFTMTDLTNGTFYMSVRKAHFTHRTEVDGKGVQVIHYLSALGYTLSQCGCGFLP